MNRVFPVFSLVLIFTGAGCQDGGQVADGQAKLGAIDSATFLDKVSSQPQVSESDAVRGVLLLIDEQDEVTFAEGVGKLRDRGIVSAGWDFQPGRPVTKGKLAYMFYKACGVRGGLTLTVSGPSQRYCLKELQYRGFMTSGLPYNTVTGIEYVGVLARADELRQTGKVSKVMSAAEGGD